MITKHYFSCRKKKGTHEKCMGLTIPSFEQLQYIADYNEKITAIAHRIYTKRKYK